ncbi:hypothetical protein G6K97_06955 [Agrobacterium rhizogenes]|uniref:hypothetical protein n=1 Tax=Rhizobium rhizogenes TaxID=359 RepID=UPI0005639F2C|nr:hypothetical protein [Rhizobium rhizogenes]NTG06945.1 hypothetical protein [Rhizobium rhizogenes]NTH82878.1 hypothetical protein [Rhizobium rhizogenes]OCJ31533.1 hypothetical protein A6U89_03925 [Agrobacterium sp. B133/95]
MALNTSAGTVISSARMAKNIIAAMRNAIFAGLDPMAAHLLVNNQSAHSGELTDAAQCKPIVKVNGRARLWISPARSEHQP